MNSVILLAILIILTYFGIALVQSYQANREEPDEMEENMQEWICPECGFNVQIGLVCIYCQTIKPDQGGKP